MIGDDYEAHIVDRVLRYTRPAADLDPVLAYARALEEYAAELQRVADEIREMREAA